MNKLIFSLLIFFFFIQFSFLPWVFSSKIANLVVLFAVSLSLVYNFSENYVWLLSAGMILELFSSGPFGAKLASLLLVSYLGDLLRSKLVSYKANNYVILPIIFFLAGAYEILDCLLAKALVALHLSLVGELCHLPNPVQSLAYLLVSAVVGLAIFRLVYWLEKHFGKSRLELKV